MDAVADGPLGADYRPTYCSAVSTHSRLFQRILADKPHPEMGYRGCLGIIGSLISTHRLAWRPRRNAHCSLERVVIRASSRS